MNGQELTTLMQELRKGIINILSTYKILCKCPQQKIIKRIIINSHYINPKELLITSGKVKGRDVNITTLFKEICIHVYQRRQTLDHIKQIDFRILLDSLLVLLIRVKYL